MALDLGDRIEDARGQRGTIRYIGPVATSKDTSTIYYGIEWDMWGHGLNDGSVTLPSGERVVYFDGPTPRGATTTTTPPQASSLVYKCSFVKQIKLDKENHHATFLDKLLERYDPAAIGGERVAAKIARGRDVVIAGEVGTTLGSGRPIELIGVDKLRTQQTLATLEKISLAQCQIHSLGITEAGELSAMTPQILELDLSFNLLKSWAPIFQVLEELPLLENLILTGNRLVYDEDNAPVEAFKIFPQVKVLVLNQTMIPWAQIMQITHRHFPQLKELHFGNNEIADADLVATMDATSANTTNVAWRDALHVLDLSDNDIHSWQTVESQLGRAFRKLKQFVLNGNHISTLATPLATTETETETKEASFQELLSLSLNDNQVDSWTSIDALNKFPQMDTFRFMRNPLTSQMGAGEARMIIVARAAYVQVFNASPVRVKERTDAEQMYLKRILHELAAVATHDANDQQETIILACHPRYKTLCDKYTEVVAAATASLRGAGASGPTTLGASLLQVKIVPMSMNATSFDPLVKKLPQQMKISQLRVFIEKKFGVVANEQLLSFRADAKSMPSPLDDDNCELSYYGLQDGAEILVNDA